jgi:predicted O-methyltransferase YrrM
MNIKQLFFGFIATRFYLPLSAFSRRLRRFSRNMRGKTNPFLQNTRLPEIAWSDFVGNSIPSVWEPQKENGNVRISELAIIAAFAERCRPDSNLFEIGTFDGRTTLNLALNAPPNCRVYTLDLPPDLHPKHELARGERHMVEKSAPGSRYELYRKEYPEAISKIRQLLGDSAMFDDAPFGNSCSLVFVDGSHAYDYAVSDTRKAFRMVEDDGIIVWHDYGIWEGVTKALEELESREKLGLLNLRGTSLVVWKKNKSAPDQRWAG